MNSSNRLTKTALDGLVVRLQKHDRIAFDQLYKQFYAGLVAFSSNYVSVEESEEIVQDTMLWIWENRENLVEEMNLKSYLFTIVKHKALNKITHLKTKNKVHQELFRKYEKEFSDPDFYLGKELLQRYQQALQAMPAEYREAFLMNRNRGMIYKDIAAELNVSPKTVNYRIGKALAFLRVELKDFLPLVLYLLYGEGAN